MSVSTDDSDDKIDIDDDVVVVDEVVTADGSNSPIFVYCYCDDISKDSSFFVWCLSVKTNFHFRFNFVFFRTVCRLCTRFV